ncbi:phosphoribosylanthranilate isomerase [Streptomyces sp. CBMA156]|uniref:phosphoribosylanthranilate isomerase n=1 Tax=Streptomyces sp. CBMA156 TaxID=1930280 RepID=UPI001661EACB|nr:N-(5'-phosphoribosyl)anthranilate isomerase [Streptomyces sp. CBMA156]MBD0675723.1 N-(5'-phosphoribosyl)anthranilate isomerase [Streptomyces sp. CBMA156]
MLVKICGAASAEDVASLDRAGADLVGLWHGVPGGRAELTLRHLTLIADAVHRTARLRPVLVTFLNDAEALRAATAAGRVPWVQLHGYQPPGLVRALKSTTDLTVVKVLHLGTDTRAERSLIAAYERAGTDFFLLDAVAADGRIGSTGQPADCEAVLGIADRLSRPFLLAGGVSADNREDYRAVVDHPLFLGIDVDTAARDPDGRLSTDRITTVRHGWRVPDGAGAAGGPG